MWKAASVSLMLFRIGKKFFGICQVIESKFGTVIELCIFYPNSKQIMLVHANEFNDVIFVHLKGLGKSFLKI